jgi:hypothetical protein
VSPLCLFSVFHFDVSTVLTTCEGVHWWRWTAKPLEFSSSEPLTRAVDRVIDAAKWACADPLMAGRRHPLSAARKQNLARQQSGGGQPLGDRRRSVASTTQHTYSFISLLVHHPSLLPHHRTPY